MRNRSQYPFVYNSDKENKKWLEKKLKKHKYWPVKRFLENLRIPYKEYFKESETEYTIVAPLFGVKFRFGGAERIADNEWKVVFLDPEILKKIPDYFYEDIMWYLIDHGLFSYLRDVNERIHRTILVDQGWGKKIIDKRLEFYGNKPEYNFKRIKNKEALNLPMVRVISIIPGFFDHLF